MAGPAADLVGRDEELAAIARFLETSAPACAVAIEGEPGIGKTTVWEAAIAETASRGARTLRARPAQSEAKLSFSSLADLLGETLSEVTLPAPQRRALETALLIDEGGRADRRAVAAGLLSALRALAAEAWIVVAIDDVQWLDRASASALEFALRRLHAEPVVLLAARRLGAGDGAALELTLPHERTLRLAVGPLGFIELNTVLQERLGTVLSRPQLRRVHELSGGNAFFALELARAPERLEPGRGLPATLDAIVQDRIGALPTEARRALLATAALSDPTVEVVEQVAGADALAPAEAAHVVLLEHGTVRFEHPLLASAAYEAADPPERREVHRTLASLAAEPEERARHLAASAAGPREEIASALEEGAAQARARGAPAAAAELSEQAAQLTPAARDADKLRRLADAGYYHFESGDGRRARALLEQVAGDLPAGPERAGVLIRLARVRSHADDLQLATDLFLQAADEAGDDRLLKARALEGAAAQLFRRRTRLAEAVDHAKAAAGLAEEAADEHTLALALGSQLLAEATIGRAEAAETLEAALSLQQAVRGERILGQPEWAAAIARMWWEEPGGVRQIYEQLIERGEDNGDESSLAYVYVMLAQADCLLGDFERARRDAEAAREIAGQASQEALVGYALAVRALADAHRGQEAETREAAASALELAETTQFTPVRQSAAAALGLLELSLGNPQESENHLGPLVQAARDEEIAEPGLTRFVPDQVEALVELGRVQEAEKLLGWYESNAQRLGRRGALACCLRCRGLLAAAEGRLDDSISLLEQALGEHDATPFPFDRARTLLALGAALRRGKRKADARKVLEAAVAAFDGLGAEKLGERARSELARIGGRRRSGDLTATQRQIAELVAAGRSNKEVAAALFVTVKTIEANLSRIYAKLGVRSRGELAHRLAAKEPATKL